MSFKAKDLHFDNSQPAFLQRLRGQLQNGDSARHEHPVARNKRAKEDDDDGPTYVMEETSQSLTKEEYKALMSGKDANENKSPSEHDAKEKESISANKASEKSTAEVEVSSHAKIVEVGAKVKKRKIAKIIGDVLDEDSAKGHIGNKQDASVAKKPKKKIKAIKLTFGDEEG